MEKGVHYEQKDEKATWPYGKKKWYKKGFTGGKKHS